jgi:hypothetical protein
MFYSARWHTIMGRLRLKKAIVFSAVEDALKLEDHNRNL